VKKGIKKTNSAVTTNGGLTQDLALAGHSKQNFLNQAKEESFILTRPSDKISKH